MFLFFDHEPRAHSDQTADGCCCFGEQDCEGLTAQFVGVLDPAYTFLTRKALKETVALKFKEEKEEAKREVEKATAVSLTSDMWASIYMDTYLAVTCEQDTPSTVLLGVGHFPKTHTAENISEGKKALMEDWCIQNKVRLSLMQNQT